MMQNPIFRFTLVTPDGKRAEKQAEVTGYINDLKAWIDLQLHGKPGARIENLREVDAKGNDVPDQHEFLAQPADNVRAVIAVPVAGKPVRHPLPKSQPE